MMRITRFAAIVIVLMMMSLFIGCSDELSICHTYDFTVETLPIQKRIRNGETAEIRCRIVRSGEWSQARYFLRYFQPDGVGELQYQNGILFRPNDLYELSNEEFRLYYTSHCTDRQTIDLYFFDDSGKSVTLSISFENEKIEKRIDKSKVNYVIPAKELE